MKESSIEVKDLLVAPHSTLVGYPKAAQEEIKSRVNELQRFKIEKIILSGQTSINGIPILGKGYVGVVVLVKKSGKKYALKIRRTDSQRKEMKNEARLLKLVNAVGVGPKVVQYSDNFILMEYLSGEKIGNWVKDIDDNDSVIKIKKVIRKVLEDCRKLDEIGFDHGELSSITKHVIVGKKISLIDFESASTERKTSNVTSAAQALFIGSGISKNVGKIYRLPPRTKIIMALREYKQSRSKNSFDTLLKTLKL